MNQPDSQHIRKSISRLRRLALLSAVSILILNAWMVFRITSVLDHGSAAKINISGAQRTYSQRIRSDAFEIETAVRYGQWDKLQGLLGDLKQTTERFSEAHQQLFTRRSPGELFGNATTHEADLVASIQVPTQQMVSGSKELQKLTENAILRSPYVDELTINRILAAKQEIAKAHSAYMPRMETIVDLFEQASRDEINASVRHARLAMLVLLCLLTASILFIIEPTILIIRRQLKDLDRATHHARRADAVRWRLLTNMGHEFRTPMNAVMGFADLLRENNLTAEERARMGQSIYDSSKQLTHMIETMLDISAIESGQLRIMPTRCDLHRLLEGIRESAQSRASENGLDLGFIIDDSCPRHINTDTKRMSQILEKLTDNAVKFTESGRIDFSARFIADPGPGVLEIIVSDTGIGVGHEYLDSIFDPFKQAEDDLTRKFGGAGLGLTIARDLARALGGNITVISDPGKGSTFTLTIVPAAEEDTLASEEPARDETPAADPLRDRRILIVDDAKDNRVLLQHIFKNTGARIDFAHDGRQALQAVRAARSGGNPFDLILMDMQMPVLDGYTATATLRDMGVTTPIIALTAHALDGDREHCLTAGCDEYISKPVNRTRLLGICNRLVKPAAPQRRAA